MRMWMVNPSLMCHQHLLGEHRELHAIVGCLRFKKNIDGYLIKYLIDLNKLKYRHDFLMEEMIRRNYNHKTPLNTVPSFDYINEDIRNNTVDINTSYSELLSRCTKCRSKHV